MAELIRNFAAWFSTDEAAAWMKATFGDGQMLMRRVDPHGIEFTAEGRDGVSRSPRQDGVSQVSFGVRSEDLVPLGRYILAVAAAQGQNINAGFQPKELS